MKSHFRRIKMDVRLVFFSLVLFGILHVATLRSIDQIIEDAETDFEKNYTGPMSRLPSQVWYDYEVKGRSEELVKLQLDMIITKDVWDTIIDTEDALPSRAKRNAVKDKTKLWPRRIPYILNDDFDISDKFKLVMAMDHWEEHTCLEFVKADETKDFDIIEFVPIPYGCESLLGRMQGRQPINLAPPCMYKEVIVHEIGHALGLYHEHMRADRDNHVTVNYQNIKETNHPQFDKLKADQFDGYDKPYDYESIMHYGKLFYSLNRTGNLITIEPKDAAYFDVIGEAPSLSFYDVKIVNEMYECSGGCEHKVCPGNGFLGKNCECYCTGKDAYEIVLCDRTENCGRPNISLSQYFVFTNNVEHEITSWDEESEFYPHGTHFVMEHKDESCGYNTATFNCSDGQWEGELLPCEKACLVGKLSDDYIIKRRNEIMEPGDEVLSADGVYVSCRNSRKGTNNTDEYIACSDGEWLRNISDMICIKENCGRPNISLSQYFVFTNNVEHEITSWDEESEFYPHGTHFVMEHKDESCGYNTATFNCSDGQWDGELLPCEKACLVGKFSDDYIIKRGNEILEPGDMVLSADGVYVSCRNSRKGTDNPDEYIACSDGEWLRNISDMICIKENCGRPNISLSQYFVFTNNLEHEITFWDEEAEFYPHGTHFIMEHKDESCGYNTATFNCSDGQWEGELLPCEKACLVGQFSDDYVIKRGNEIIEPGDEVLSADGVYVSCRNSRKGTDNLDEYIACSDGEWLRNISDMICIKENCGRPNISLSQYFVFTNFEHEITSWDEEAEFYPHGTHFIMEHKDESCGYNTATFNCSDGQWDGELLPCEKACLVGQFGDDYVIKRGDEIMEPGDEVLSAHGVYVSCKNSRKGTDNPDEYIACSDGEWLRNISDMICIKEHPLCPMVVNSQLTGSFDDGFSVTCLEGYEIETEGEPVSSFRCTSAGEWEPFTPVCNPAHCTIPLSKNSAGQLNSQNGDEVLRGSEITHGSDVTLICPRGHIPEPVTISCQYGQWDRKVPECILVTCPEPLVVDAKYRPQQDVYIYGDSVKVGRCKGILALEGSRDLQCNKFGSWTGSAVCKPFCDDGELKFDSMKNKEFRDDVWHKKVGLSSFAACEKKCRRYKRFLCLSFAYGVKRGRQFCHLHPQNPAEMPERVQTRSFYTIGVRQCIRN